VRVLVVDDEADIREAIRILLEDEGYQVVLAYTMHAAIKAIRYEKIDAILLDVFLDGEPIGLEIARHAHLHEIPVYILSGAEPEPIRRLAAINALQGVRYWFTKPLGDEKMLDLLSALSDIAKAK
jgi:two-component system, OmpR family, response regulator VicR